MNDCLLTSLKGSIDNPSLPILGTLIVDEYVNNRIAYLNGASDYALEVTVLDDNTIAAVRQGTNTLVDSKHAIIGVGSLLPNGLVLGAAATGVRLKIRNKYEIKELRIYGIDGGLERLSACLKLENLYMYGNTIVGNLSDLAELTSLKIISNQTTNMNIAGDIRSLGSLLNLEIITLFETSCYGDIQYLGTCTQLRQILLGYHRQVTGSIENFVARQRGAGRTTLAEENKLDLGVPSLWGVYFNGEPATSSSRTYLYWDANTITYGGTTINNDDVITPET